MPRIETDRIGVAFDMRGCPNRCRHCYLGARANPRLLEEDIHWGVNRFRGFLAAGSMSVKKLSVATWFHEPDFGDDYRRLHELEAELSDGPPSRYELLSVWRLARDASYASWAKSVGPDTCQISFFGMRQTNDWFCRREGAFDDALTATDRLLGAGMKPRWQIFLTTKLLPELEALLALIDERRIRERVAELGDTFHLFMHPPGPDGDARDIEALRPTDAALADLPESVLAPTRQHFGTDVLWRTEASLYADIAENRVSPPDAEAPPPWFYVCGNWDVYSNAGTLEPWYRLGNLKTDPLDTIVRRYAEDTVLGLHVQFHEVPAELAKRYGNPEGRKVYSSEEDLLSLYRAQHCERGWRGK